MASGGIEVGVDAVDAFADAWAGAGLSSALPRDLLARRVERGWSAEVVSRVQGLVDHAIAVGASVASTGVRWEVQRLLFDLANEASRRLPIPLAEGWLAVLASETDVRRYGWLTAGLTPLLVSADWRDATLEFEVWCERGGSMAPLAWAAGLTVEEGESRLTEGALTEKTQELRTLAALRGYRLPLLLAG